jgi:hypothetical protein
MSATPGTTHHISSRTNRLLGNMANPVTVRAAFPIAAGLMLAVGVFSPGSAAPAQAIVIEDRQTASTPIVIGTGPNAVYVGPAPTVGGDPARGETDDSYSPRTGRHLPGRSSAAGVDGAWWYGPAPLTGDDPALGETDDSYSARTGRQLPGWSSSAAVEGLAPVTGGDPALGETDDSYSARTGRHLPTG